MFKSIALSLLGVLLVLGPSWSQASLCYQSISNKPKAPLVAQETIYTCGPASFSSWAKEHGLHFTENYLAQIMKTTPQWGTHYKDFVNGVGELGLEAKFLENLNLQQLQSYLKRSFGVVLNFQLEGEGHWARLIDIDFTKSEIQLMDPWYARKNLGYRTMSFQELNEAWFDFFGSHKKRKNQAAILIAPKGMAFD